MSKYKIALVSISINPNYWQYITPMIESAKKFLLRGHEVDFIVWSDMPQDMPRVGKDFKVIPTEACAWPMPTLHRFHLFLREEELLKDYDFLFYVDADMLFVSPVGDEILGEGLTAAQHPMYAVRRDYLPPYEPNHESTSYIKRPGRVIGVGNKKRFEALYFAGGFQGGRTMDFIKAMHEMKGMIDKDFQNNYIPIWNDETAWNKYLCDNPPSVVLSPSYIYPDSLNKSYYQKLWGRNYVPKLVTITKPFSLTKEGGYDLAATLQNI